MVNLRTHVPFSSAAFKKYNARQELTVTVTTAVTFDIETGQPLRVSQKQPDIRLSDVYDDAGTPHARLIQVSDFVPFRPVTDVVLLGSAHSPDGSPSKMWEVSVDVGGLSERLRVFGPRQWVADRQGQWSLTDADPVREVPLDWRLAAGGPMLVPEDHELYGDVDIWNPVGAGVIVSGVTPTDTPLRAPQIEGVDAPVIQAGADIMPRNLAPIAPVWRSREQHAGSYDKTWLETQHPFLPANFDPKFYNVAAPNLQGSPYLRGDEIVQLKGVDPDHAELRFSLPGLAFGAVASHDNGLTVRQPMNLDLVEFDLRSDVKTVRMAWRSAFPWRDGITTADIGELAFETLHPTATETGTDHATG